MENKPTTQSPSIKEPEVRTQPKRQVGGPQSGLPPPFIVGSELAPWLTVGIDFGTYDCRVCTCSGGDPYRLDPYEFSTIAEDVLKIGVNNKGLSHTIKDGLSDGVHFRANDLTYTGSELATMLFNSIKSTFERNTERLLAKAVFSVPASFNHRQRMALIRAVQNSGIALLGLINDTTAAMLHAAYSSHVGSGKYLVISSGIFSFEVAVVQIENKLIETRAIRSNRSLSSHQITKLFVEKMRPSFPNASNDKLIVVADRAKRRLSSRQTADVQVDDRRISLHRTEAATWLSSFRTDMAEIINETLRDASIHSEEIDGVVLAGGGSRLWLLQELLAERFGADRILPTNIAAGASIYAALLVRQAKDWVVWDALARSVHYKTANDEIKKLLAQNSPLPSSGHAALTVDAEGNARTAIIETGSAETQPTQVAQISIVEKLKASQQVDLQVTATADGTLSFTARLAQLDANLTVTIDDSWRGDSITFDLT